MEPPPTDLVVLKGFRAVLHQGVRAHVIVGTHPQTTEGVHQGVVSIATVARTEEILDQGL